MNRLVVQQAAPGWSTTCSKPRARRGRAGRDHRLRRPPQERRVRAGHRSGAVRRAGVRAMIFPHVVPDAGAGLEHHRRRRRRRRDGHRLAQPAGRQRLQGVHSPTARRSCRRSTPRSRPCIDRVDPCDVPLAEPDDPLIERLDDVVRRRLPRRRAGGAAAARRSPACRWPTRRCTASAARRCSRHSTAPGSPAPFVVAEQQQPDPRVPDGRRSRTPKSPARWTCCSLRRPAYDAAIALANDPDADRLGAAIPHAGGRLAAAQGDEIGWLLADHILRQHDRRRPARRHHARVVVAARPRWPRPHGVQFAETFTGFKWIGHTVRRAARAALRVRLRAGARLPRAAAGRSTRTASRRRCCWPRSPRSPRPRA